MSFNTAFKIISELVNDFKDNENHYLNSSYSEADVRNDFINKFFIALGWDVRHEEQKNPYEQEVRVEKPLQIAKAQKRADYSFSLAPDYRTVKFFVEAKKPAHDLSNKDYYFQTARYGWNAGTPVAVLTDFEEFHIVDCRFRPNIDDALNYKIKQFHYSDFTDKEKFAEIYWIFSREAVADGSIEKYADTLRKPKGKKAKLTKTVLQSIDEAFLEELDEIRNELAKSFKKNNEHLSSEELTEATQRTIDRLVFIKFLEDKLIEPDHYVSDFGRRKSAWEDFLLDSRKLDAKYNGVVFKKSLIDTRNIIEPDDKTFSAICDELSHENTPYNFDAIPIHILGSIYERFLGKVVHATDKRATIEEKPEVRKAGGVYYTPQYIVDYIVINTVGKLIESKTPRQISKMRFADIACGSGSFLITVFETLLDYHKQYYQQNPEQAKKDDCILYEGAYRLSLKQKQLILTNNIYGVDIDQQAVEVTQLSLYLKLLEDETTATANDTWVMFKEQLLPDLNKNIVCGNSLIGTDILNPTSILPFGKGEDEGGVRIDELKLKPMDFEKVFSHIFSSPLGGGREGADGFDALVGNPPYVRIQGRDEIETNYYVNNYKSATGNFDIYCLFLEKTIELLNKTGIVGMIVPHRFFKVDYGNGIRNLITEKKIIESIVDFDGYMVFEKASINTAIVLLNNFRRTELDYLRIKNPSLKENEIIELIKNPDNKLRLSEQGKISYKQFSVEPWTFILQNEEKIWDKLNNIPDNLESISNNIFQGLKTGSDGYYIADIIDENTKYYICHFPDPNANYSIEKSLMFPLIKSGEIKKYIIKESNKRILFPYTNGKLKSAEELQSRFPKAWNYLMEQKSFLYQREKGKLKNAGWYGYTRTQALENIFLKKIITPEYYSEASFAIDETGNYMFCGGGAGGYAINLKEGISYYYILALLNSKLLDWYLKKISMRAYQTAFMYTKKYISKFPIIIVGEENKLLQSIEKVVHQILTTKKQLEQAKTEGDKNYLQRKCETLDEQIDALVYQLYGLTEEEIKIVEGSVK